MGLRLRPSVDYVTVCAYQRLRSTSITTRPRPIAHNSPEEAAERLFLKVESDPYLYLASAGYLIHVIPTRDQDRCYRLHRKSLISEHTLRALGSVESVEMTDLFKVSQFQKQHDIQHIWRTLVLCASREFASCFVGSNTPHEQLDPVPPGQHPIFLGFEGEPGKCPGRPVWIFNPLCIAII